jgi:two-component system cell cycle response regulator DivK
MELMSRCILVVEDNPFNQELDRAVLESHGFEVIEAGDATECFDVLSHRKPDLVLMDIQLPGKDGLQITRELRTNPEMQDLVIVAMTAHAMLGDERRMVEAGCDGYLPKPIDTRTLGTQVEAFLHRGREGGSAG